MLSRQRLVRIAKVLRAELEQLVEVKENGQPILECFDSGLGGSCMYGAIMVFQALKRMGRNPQIVEGDGHWFAHCDGYLIDITASQFGMKDVEVRLIGSVDTMTQCGFWHPCKKSRTIRGVDYGFDGHHRDLQHARKLMKGGT